MSLSIAHLGPSGTFAEAAALMYSTWLNEQTHQETCLCPYPSIAQTIQATAQGEVALAVVPVENSIEGSVTTTLDTLWRCDTLQIQQGLVLPISHAFITRAKTIAAVKTVYSHPQALAQCHQWLEKFLPAAQIVSTNSTTEALQYLDDDLTTGAIASPRAAELYQLPVLACPINDHPDNCTRFWVLGLKPSPGGHCTSLAFTVHDVPGALLKPLQVFAQQGINLSKIESRPTKKSLGDYLFFVDLEADARENTVQEALKELAVQTETLKVFGSYEIL
jgi:prephenate dehydratase